MNCPRCDVALDEKKFKDIDVDHCPQCKGLWLDFHELDQLEAHSMDEDSRKGLGRLGIEIPATEHADPFVYGAYVTAIELLKDVAPFTCFLEHDVPRQRLFQSALAAYGREG